MNTTKGTNELNSRLEYLCDEPINLVDDLKYSRSSEEVYEMPVEDDAITDAVDAFDDDFLESLKQLNEENDEGDFLNTLEMFDTLSHSLGHSDRSLIEKEVADSIDFFDEELLKELHKCDGLDETESSRDGPERSSCSDVLQDKDKVFDPYVVEPTSFREHKKAPILNGINYNPRETVKTQMMISSNLAAITAETIKLSSQILSKISSPPPACLSAPLTTQSTSRQVLTPNLPTSAAIPLPAPSTYEVKYPTDLPASCIDEASYKDFGEVSDEEAGINVKFSNMRGRAQATFQVKLHSILERSEKDGYANIISWLPHGRGFRVHDQDLFLDKILRRFFFQTKMSSFTRQLGMYGFQKIIGKKNLDRGAYFHELFLRGRPGLCKTMGRQGKNCKRTILDADNEPLLYAYKPMPKTKIEEEDISEPSATKSATHPKEIKYARTAATPAPILHHKSLYTHYGAQNLTPQISYLPVNSLSNLGTTPNPYSQQAQLAIVPGQFPQILGTQLVQPVQQYVPSPITMRDSQQRNMPYVVLRGFTS